MNNNEHTIHYNFDKDGYCDTQCPHYDFLIRVGSQMCYECTYFVSHDYARRNIVCSCPENTINKDFVHNIFFHHS